MGINYKHCVEMCMQHGNCICEKNKYVIRVYHSPLMIEIFEEALVQPIINYGTSVLGIRSTHVSPLSETELQDISQV